MGKAQAEVEWVKAQQLEKPHPDDEVEQLKPSYFNTGCCCFPDGDVTGLEIIDGEIRLVRWPDGAGKPIRNPDLAHAKLTDIFAEL